MTVDRIRLGTSPDSWGVWFADDPAQTPWPRFLDEVVTAGYEWIELGPYGSLPTDPGRLADELGRRGLRATGPAVFADLHHGAAGWDRLLADAPAVGRLVRAVGARHLVHLVHLVHLPTLYRTDGTGGFRDHLRRCGL